MVTTEHDLVNVSNKPEERSNQGQPCNQGALNILFRTVEAGHASRHHTPELHLEPQNSWSLHFTTDLTKLLVMS